MSETLRRPLRLSLTTEGAMFAPDEQHRLLDVARAADQAGADFVDVTEHVLMGLNTLQVGQGWELHHLEQPQPEALATLAAMAGATQRINLLSGIVIAPLRPAGLLAKTGATLHALSRGRFVMGVTTSWQKDECDALPDIDGSLPRSMDQIPALAEAGINIFRIHLRRFSTSPDAVLPLVDEVTHCFEQFRALRA